MEKQEYDNKMDKIHLFIKSEENGDYQDMGEIKTVSEADLIKESPLFGFKGIEENFPKLETELNKLKQQNKPSEGA